MNHTHNALSDQGYTIHHLHCIACSSYQTVYTYFLPVPSTTHTPTAIKQLQREYPDRIYYIVCYLAIYPRSPSQYLTQRHQECQSSLPMHALELNSARLLVQVIVVNHGSLLDFSDDIVHPVHP